MTEIPAITLTGLDERTDIDWLVNAIKASPLLGGRKMVEFGILRSPKAGQSPRYPSTDVIDRITSRVPAAALAFHLCGRYARMVHEGEWWHLAKEIDFNAVGRVQVNSTECDEKAMITLQRFSHFINRPVIMQWRSDKFPLVPGLHLLQDRSGGRGVVETFWTKPDEYCRNPGTEIGYAGGLNPSNIAEALPAIARSAQRPHFWVDCESGIRTDDWFDTAKAQLMVDAVLGRWLKSQEYNRSAHVESGAHG